MLRKYAFVTDEEGSLALLFAVNTDLCPKVFRLKARRVHALLDIESGHSNTYQFTILLSC